MGQGASSTPLADLPSTAPETGFQWRWHTSEEDDDEGADVVERARWLYDQLPTHDAAPVWRTVAAALRRAYPSCDVALADHVLRVMWADGGGPPTEVALRRPARARARSLTTLVNLERVAQAVLRHDAAFTPDDRHLEPADYAEWAEGGTVADDHWQPLVRRMGAPSPATPVLKWFQCHRGVVGAVGWFWLLPLLELMYGEPGAGTVRESRVRCPPALDGLLPSTVAPRIVCPGVPAGCALVVHHWPAGTWGAHAPLVRHLARALCFENHAPWGDPARPRAHRFDRAYPVSPDSDDLALLVLGGALPLAWCGFEARPRYAYVGSLCSVARSRGGSYLLGWLQRRSDRVELETAGDDLVEFYTRAGFVPGPDGLWCWRRPGKRPRDTTSVAT